MAKRTPTDGTSNNVSDADRAAALRRDAADHRKVRLPDPEKSGQFDPAIATDPYGLPDFHVHEDDMTSVIVAEHAHPYDGPHEHADALPAVPPSDVQAADPPATPDVSGETPEPSHTPDVAAGSGGRVGRPLEVVAPPLPPAKSSNVRSVGRVIANSAVDAALGAPVALQDERAHAREAVELLLEAAAEYHRHNQPMPAERLLDLEAIVLHMVGARGLRQIAATHGIDLDGGDES